MKKSMMSLVACIGLIFSNSTWADDLVGIWQNIDDKTGSPKALIEISRNNDGIYSGKIVKVTPRTGYTPQEKCIKCPAPYTDQPILGIEVFNGLTEIREHVYSNGKILDPLSGGIYSLKGKLSANKKRLHLRGFIGVSAIGRTQIWIRQD